MMFKGFLLEYHYSQILFYFKCISWKFGFRNSTTLIALKMFCNSLYEEQARWQQYLTTSIAENFFWLWINDVSCYVVYPWVWIFSLLIYSRLKWLLPFISGILFSFGTRYCDVFPQVSFWLKMYTTSQIKNIVSLK